MLLLFFGVVGFAVSTAMIADEQSRTHKAYEELAHEQTLTKKAFEDERKRAGEAEQRFRLARRSADEMIRLAEEETANNPHMQNLRRLLLESALAYYQEFIELRRDDADAQVELAATRDRVQTILSDLALLQGAGRHFLLKDSAVLKDLKLSEPQRTALAELMESMDKQRSDSFRDFHKLPPQERPKFFLESVRATETAIAKILVDPRQLRRLQQIAWQCQGPRAFQEPDVIAALKLTPEEQNKIRAIEGDMFFGKPPFERPDGPPDGPPEGPPKPAFYKNRLAAMTQIYQVLGDERTNLWKKLIGPPFVDAERIGLPGVFPGPPPPDGPPLWPNGGKSQPFRPK